MGKNQSDSNQEASKKVQTRSANKRSNEHLDLRNFIPGILIIGVLLGIVIILIYQVHLPQITKLLYRITLFTFGVAVFSIILFYAFKRKVTSVLFGSDTANSGGIIDDAHKITDALTERFTEALPSEVPPDVRKRIKFVVPRLMNWFIWNRFRNWWWQWVLSIFLSLGGLTGTLLLINQNELLQNQNVLIQRQMSLEEANRRSALVVLMSNIMDKVDKEIERQQIGLSEEQISNRKYKLSQSLIGQIAALSHSFKPYRFMDGDSLINRPQSPERGQLLITLCFLPLDSLTLAKIFKTATFESANLESAKLNYADWNRADFERAILKKDKMFIATLFKTVLTLDENLDSIYLNKTNSLMAILIRAHLRGAYLANADLVEANLSNADLNRGDLNEADLSKADLISAEMAYANLQSVKLVGANLTNVNLTYSDLENANLRYANLSHAKLNYSNLENANLDEADLSYVNFLNTYNLSVDQLSKSKTLYQCKNLHDSLKLSLQKRHPNLFKALQ
ncbi:MAG: pentapeptide repeat-containing protein [Saprospiraceae bacterium]|nr:pentapeptide repeat-containing protein [Saprospiraceae bacterium]